MTVISQLVPMVVEQVIDWIAERAEATEQVLSFSELMRPAA
jgi:trigger factor